MTGAVPPAFPTGGTILPGYVAISLLQQGRDYETYDAWSRLRSARCVVKVLRGDKRRSRSSRSRLLLEGRLLTTLSHPNLVRGYEVHTKPRAGVIIETLGGATLRYLLGRSGDRLSIASLAHLGEQLSSAAAYLHASGYLHLDIKPSNIIVDGGRARLIDLSLAQPPGAVPRGLGTASYLSPEQGTGTTAGPAADVWGIGLTLYEAAAGRNPFRGSRPAGGGGAADDLSTTRGQTCSTCGERLRFPQVRARAPSISTQRRLPRALREAIDAALEPNPDHRPSTEEFRMTMCELTPSIATAAPARPVEKV